MREISEGRRREKREEEGKRGREGNSRERETDKRGAKKREGGRRERKDK